MFTLKNASLCLLVVFFVQANSAIAAASKKINFHQIKIESPVKLILPVVIADILPVDGKEVLIFGVDENRLRWLLVYSFDSQQKSYQLADKIIIPAHAFSFDIGEIEANKLQKLYFMTSSQLLTYRFNKSFSQSTSESSLENSIQNTAESTFSQIAEISSIYLKDNPQFISRGNFIVDLNGDNLDDAIIADFVNVQLLSGQPDGLMKSQQLPIKAQVELDNNSASYWQNKLYINDVNFDGFKDVILVGDGELEVYAQDQFGVFSQEVLKIAIKKSIQGREWWNKKDDTGQNLDQSNLIYRKLEELRDINNDGVADMVVRFTQSSGLLDRVNDYEVYFGKNKQGELTFTELANSVIHTDGTLSGVEFIDIDNDKKLEVILAGFDIGISQIIGALLSGSIDQDVYLFKMDAQGNFSKKPNVSKEVDLNFSLSSGQSGSPVVKLADLNGDKLKDLILSSGDDALKIYYGTRGRNVFVKRGITYKTTLPKDGGTLMVDDLNNDGKDDILINYSRQDAVSLHKTIKILLSE